MVSTAPTVVDFGRRGLDHSIAVIFIIRPRLCFGTVLRHLVVVFLPIHTCTLCLTIPSTVPPGVSLQVGFRRFQLFRLNARAQTALLIDDKDAGLPYNRNQ